MTRRGWTLFLALSVIWGLPYFLIRVAVAELDPGFLVAARMLLATLILVPVAILRGGFGGLRGYWPWVFVLAVVEMIIPFGLLNWAETRLSSSVTGLMIAAVPIVSALLAARLGLADRLDNRRYLGLGIGLVGVTVLVGLDLTVDQIWATAALGLVVIGYAVGPIVIATHLSEVPGPQVMAAASAITLVVYLPWLLFATPSNPVDATTWWAVIGLGVVCSAVALLVFFALVTEVGPTRMTVITYLNPLVAVALGVGLLAESLTTGILLGFPLIILGSYLSTAASSPRRADPRLSPPPDPPAVA